MRVHSSTALFATWVISSIAIGAEADGFDVDGDGVDGISIELNFDTVPADMAAPAP